ncbi:MAG: hypothetical protein GQF41_4305 [Candidatus Rifleibacterium amylolyticum]|nr:MAG: hypothetical protein GQF41_4305 [Candidatus Rifleibacterium amylolyticum]
MKRPFGDRIRLARKNKRLSLEDVVKKLNDQHVSISISYLSQMEVGKREPPSVESIVVALATVLDIDSQELVKLARSDRDKIELGLLNLGPKKRSMAIELQRSWTQLSEDEAQQIETIIRKLQGG